MLFGIYSGHYLITKYILTLLKGIIGMKNELKHVVLLILIELNQVAMIFLTKFKKRQKACRQCVSQLKQVGSPTVTIANMLNPLNI